MPDIAPLIGLPKRTDDEILLSYVSMHHKDANEKIDVKTI
ncbi:MAG: hypothetical protein RLZZ237_396 [Pseudomonadota bacterium]|jgi:hypothetical protein